MTVGAFAKICARFRLFIIKDQLFIRIYFSFGTPGLKVASNDGMFLDYIISEHYFVKRIRLQRNLKSCLFDLNLPLTEFVGNKSSIFPNIKPLFRGWCKEKCMYWNVSAALKCVWTLSSLFDEKLMNSHIEHLTRNKGKLLIFCRLHWKMWYA